MGLAEVLLPDKPLNNIKRELHWACPEGRAFCIYAISIKEK
jgi:hypothetical protein